MMHPRIQEVSEYFDAQRRVLRAAYDALPPPLRETRLAPDRWSAADIVEHLAIVEGRVGGMLAKKLAAAQADGLAAETSDDAIVPSVDLARIATRETRVTAPEMVLPTGVGGDAAWEALERATTALHRLLRDADGLAVGTITHVHPLFGFQTFYQWIVFLGAHEARHAEQIREIAAAGSAS